MKKGGLWVDWPSSIWGLGMFAMILTLRLLNLTIEPWLWYQLLPKYQPNEGGWFRLRQTFFDLNVELKTIIKLQILIKQIQEHNSIATQI